MKIIEIYTNLFCLYFDNKYDLVNTFIRLQEFYESPFPEVRNKYFTLDQYVEIYKKNFNKFDYYEIWEGFNVPGNIVLDFFKQFKKLRKCEKEIKKYFSTQIKEQNPNFYLIGLHNSEALLHETAHGLFYLNRNYKLEITAIVNNLPNEFRSKFEKALKNKGYDESVFIDEIHAYSIDYAKYYNEDNPEILSNFSIDSNELKLTEPFLSTFQKYLSK